MNSISHQFFNHDFAKETAVYGVRGDVANRIGILGLEELTEDHGGVRLLPAYSTLLQRGLGLYFSSLSWLKNSFANRAFHSVKTV